MNDSSRGASHTRRRLREPNTPTPTQRSRLDYHPSNPNHALLFPLIPPWRPLLIYARRPPSSPHCLLA
eukprot:1912486-Pleurochrysis_carterae.AAC.1